MHCLFPGFRWRSARRRSRRRNALRGRCAGAEAVPRARLLAGAVARLSVEVKSPSVTHTLVAHSVEDWLNGGAKSPKEAIEKRRLKELPGSCCSRSTPLEKRSRTSTNEPAIAEVAFPPARDVSQSVPERPRNSGGMNPALWAQSLAFEGPSLRFWRDTRRRRNGKRLGRCLFARRTVTPGHERRLGACAGCGTQRSSRTTVGLPEPSARGQRSQERRWTASTRCPFP